MVNKKAKARKQKIQLAASLEPDMAFNNKPDFAFGSAQGDDKPQQANHDGDDLLSQIARLFNNPRLSDVSITIGNTSLPAHRLVLCLQSSYFSTALKKDFAEGQSHILKCEDGKEHAYVRMLQYLYRGVYDEKGSSLLDVEDDSDIMKHPRVYFLADLYLLEELKATALLKFSQGLEHLWEHADLGDCIREIYANTLSGGDDLRSAVVRITADRCDQLSTEPAFQGLIREGGEFVVDLVLELSQRAQATKQEGQQAMHNLFGTAATTPISRRANGLL